MGKDLLIMNGVDYSDHIGAGDLRIKFIPVYDESGVFVSAYGNSVKRLIGHRLGLSVVFWDINDSLASSLRGLAQCESFDLTAAAPDAIEARASAESVSLEPDRAAAGGGFLWNAALNIVSDVIFLDGL